MGLFSLSFQYLFTFGYGVLSVWCYLNISVPVHHTGANGQPDIHNFVLKYNDVQHWREITSVFCAQYNLDCDVLANHIRNLLLNWQFPKAFIDNEPQTESIYSEDATIRLLLSAAGVRYEMNEDIRRPLFVQDQIAVNPLIDLELAACASNGVWCQETMIMNQSIWPRFLTNVQSPSWHLRQIIFMQNLGAVTGGTIAIDLMYKHFLQLGYNVHLCNDSNKNSKHCTSPGVEDVVVTGEWSNGVLDDYGAQAFRGRGLQYHLGFHHWSDLRRGHITITDCDYLTSSLQDRILGAYYLGCAMTDHVRAALSDNLFNTGSSPKFLKENLVVVDPDLFDDYPPEQQFDYRFPGANYVFAKEIPRSAMPNLLKRAKVVLDLAMPGPERLAGEGILFGAIPIVSKRWTGSSGIDFPGLLKVNHENVSEVYETIRYALENYEELLQKRDHGKFFNYIISMWRRSHYTSDLVLGSSSIHFVFHSHSFSEEIESCFQILSLFYLFPMCSITLYVRDVKWFMRHNYAFYSQLVLSGYIRLDPFDPSDYRVWGTATEGTSFVRIRQLSKLANNRSVEEGIVDISDTVLPWRPIIIAMRRGVTFASPFDLVDTIQTLDETDGMRINDIISGEYIASVIAPGATNEIVIQEITQAWGASPTKMTEGNDTGIPIQIRQVSLSQSSMVSICSLLNNSGSYSTVSYEVHVARVVSTLPWIKLASFLQRTVGQATICKFI